VNERDGNNRRHRRSGRRYGRGGGQDSGFSEGRDFRETQNREETGKGDFILKGEWAGPKGGMPKGGSGIPKDPGAASKDAADLPKEKFWKRKRDRFRTTAAPRYDKSGAFDRLRWTAPKLNTDPIPVSNCAFCGKPITDLHAALTDRKTGEPVHFDCVISELAEHETLGDGDVISYIGGGRFGVVHFNNSGRGETGAFTIKRIVEWEDKENRAEWRGVIADHYSVT
jgi:hypothetical protein